jgi:hypothetical protein
MVAQCGWNLAPNAELLTEHLRYHEKTSYGPTSL